MKLFSLDCSTTSASACLIETGKVVQSSSWFEERARHEGLFDIADQLISASGWSWSEIELFAAGRGPGAYSGLRVSLLAAQALAAPSGAKVVAVSSMEALAVRLCEQHELEEITIVGDARRNSVWHGHFIANATQPTEWRVDPIPDALAAMSANTILATPHWDSLQEFRSGAADRTWLDGAHIPTAEDIATLALQRLESNIEPDPVLPLYLHPAV